MKCSKWANERITLGARDQSLFSTFVLSISTKLISCLKALQAPVHVILICVDIIVRFTSGRLATNSASGCNRSWPQLSVSIMKSKKRLWTFYRTGEKHAEEFNERCTIGKYFSIVRYHNNLFSFPYETAWNVYYCMRAKHFRLELEH